MDPEERKIVALIAAFDTEHERVQARHRGTESDRRAAQARCDRGGGRRGRARR